MRRDGVRRFVVPAGVEIGLLDPVGDALPRRLRLFRDFGRGPARASEVGDALTELTRIRLATSLGHGNTIGRDSRSVQRAGATPPARFARMRGTSRATGVGNLRPESRELARVSMANVDQFQPDRWRTVPTGDSRSTLLMFHE